MCAALAPKETREALHAAIQASTGKELEMLQCFCRFNDKDTDTTFRIHSDGEVEGEQPTVAAVYYVNGGHTGTALFAHSVYGTYPAEWEERIHTENDHNWIVTQYADQRANDLFIYDARQYHSRWPAESADSRFVVVCFLKEKTND